MGLSPRYHVASLAAVFLALAVGILIGSEIGGNVLDNTRRDLEQSLTGDLDRSRAENERIRQELGWSDEFGAAALGPLTRDRLAGRRVALIGFGALPGSISGPATEAVESAGGRVVAVGVVREPPDLDSLPIETGSGIRTADDSLFIFGQRVGRQIVTGGSLFESTRSTLMSRSSGTFGGIDAVVLSRAALPEAKTGSRDRVRSRLLAFGMVSGLVETGVRLAGVETVEERPSRIPFFERLRVSSVDNVDDNPGRLALIYVLSGADGNFGVKETADSLLPEPLSVSARGGGTG